MPMVSKSALGCAAAVLLSLGAPALAEDAWYAWSPKPDKLVPYGANKPVTRLSAVLAKHKNEKRWSEQAILTPRYDVKWIQAQPGDKANNPAGPGGVGVGTGHQVPFGIASRRVGLGPAPFSS